MYNLKPLKSCLFLVDRFWAIGRQSVDGQGATLQMTNPLRFPMFQRTGSNIHLFFQWILTLFMCVVAVRVGRCCGAMVSSHWRSCALFMDAAKSTVIPMVWDACASQTSAGVAFGADLRPAPRSYAEGWAVGGADARHPIITGFSNAF